MNWNVLALTWVFMGATALAGLMLGAAWRELSLRKKWRRTEAEFEDQLRKQVAVRDSKILSLEAELGLVRATSVPAARPAEQPVYAVVEVEEDHSSYEELVREPHSP